MLQTHVKINYNLTWTSMVTLLRGGNSLHAAFVRGKVCPGILDSFDIL